MNIFYLHKDPIVAAQMSCDKHVVKMILEAGQMLCAAHWLHLFKNYYKGEITDFKRVKDLKAWLIDDANTHTQSTADGTSTVVLTFQSRNERRSRGITDKSPQQRPVEVGASGGNQHVECGMGRFTPFVKPYGYWSAYFRQNSYLEPTKNTFFSSIKSTSNALAWFSN